MKYTLKVAGGLYDPYVMKNPVKEKWDNEVQLFN
jgi:hypothetical protein